MSESNCTCSACSRCCKFLPGALSRVSDLDRLERATRGPQEPEETWARRMFVASAGALVADTRTGERIQIPNLALKSAKNGHCVHFKAGRCSIYEARPSACAEFDSCIQTDAEAKALGAEMHAARLEEFQAGGRYARLWQLLHDAGQRRTMAAIQKRVKKLNRKYR